jgi:1-acyl-sn-glycerol-3-phosphate acyltransferase
VPLRSYYQLVVPADARGNAMAVMNTVYYGLTTALAVLLFALARVQALTLTGQLGLLAVLAALGALASWRALFRESFELALEVFLWPLYRIRGHGPGLDRVPVRGPLLIVANHSSWLDPPWLAKVIPRRITAMMTSLFYDLPVLHWFMRRVFQAIRVEASTFRREAPEIQLAVEALDRGECVLIFPEGFMRRRADQLLRPFGQGVWHILRQRPATPVLVCWIEGGWGTFTSYQPDWWRRIDVAVSEPRVLDPSLLADHRATRTYLMQACLDARRHLGLEEPPDQGPGQQAPALAGEEPEEG